MRTSEVIRKLIDLAYYEEGMAAECGSSLEVFTAEAVRGWLGGILSEPYKPEFPSDEEIRAIYEMFEVVTHASS